MMSNPSFKTIYIIIAILLSNSLVYAKTYTANSDKRINVEISQTGVNRIEVKKDRIAKVIGNQDEYSVEGDNKTGVIFLSAKGVAGETLPITIITEKGLTQDINLKVTKASEPKVITIAKRAIKETTPTRSDEKTIQARVVEAIKDISSGNARHFTKREVKEFTKNNPNSLTAQNYKSLIAKQIVITKAVEYSDRFLKIIKYEYTSKPSDMGIKQIKELFREALSVSIRGNAIMVVYKI